MAVAGAAGKVRPTVAAAAATAGDGGSTSANAVQPDAGDGNRRAISSFLR